MRGPCGPERLRGFEELPEQRPRQWRREDVALAEVDAALAQEFDLLEGLDAFGEDLDAHVARKVDQRLDDGGRVTFRADGIDEQLVDLDVVYGELEHVGQT